MRLRISKRNKNNDLPATEVRVPGIDDTAITNTEKEILTSLANDYPKYYNDFEWYPDENLVDVLEEIFNDDLSEDKNTLVLGRPGWGKTEAIQTLAEKLGIKYHVIQLATSQPEDIAGIPKVNNINGAGATDMLSGYKDWLDKSAKDKKDIEENINKSFSTVSYAPPDWMKKTLIDGALYGKKSIWFFDEINLADTRVISAAFKTINEKVIPSTNISLVPYVFLIAAGNFSSDNPDVQTLSEPAMDRFPNKIAIVEDWNSGLKAALASWKRKKPGLNNKIVAIVDKIMTDPGLRDLVESINDLRAAERMNSNAQQNAVQWKNLSPRWFTQKVIPGIYKAVNAYYDSNPKDPTLIGKVFKGAGKISGISMPNDLATYLIQKIENIENIDAPTTNGTATGRELELLKEAAKLGNSWVIEGQIPKTMTPSKKNQFLGTSEDIEEDLKTILDALQILPEFTDLVPASWEAVSTAIRPTLKALVAEGAPRHDVKGGGN